MKVPYLPLLALLFTGIAAAQDLRNTPAAQAACGPVDTKFTTELATPAPDSPTPDKALIYIVQISDVDGHSIGSWGPLSKLGMDAKWLGATQGNSFLAFSVTPGVHHLCASWESSNKKLSQLVALNLVNAEPKKVYFFALNTLSSSTQGGGSVQFSLTAINEDEGRMLISVYPESRAKAK
jgi:hypothetical protein